MKFKIIPNEQTPKIETYKGIKLFLAEDRIMLEKFISFARLQHNCAGLAANQVSCNGKRIMESFFAMKTDGRWDMIIQPEIKGYSGRKEKKYERCLTWLGRKIIAERYTVIGVTYYDLKGERIKKTLVGFHAQIFQHEYNHLMGIEEKFIE
jgi:peptide deformylase